MQHERESGGDAGLALLLLSSRGHGQDPEASVVWFWRGLGAEGHEFSTVPSIRVCKCRTILTIRWQWCGGIPHRECEFATGKAADVVSLVAAGRS